MMNIPEELSSIFPDTENIVSIQKNTVETLISSSDKISPMVVLFLDSDTPHLSVACPLAHDFESTMQNVCSALHLYRATDSTKCYITLPSIYEYEGKEYTSLNIFYLSYNNAYAMTLPYRYEESTNSVEWFDNLSTVSQVDDQDLDATGKQIITAFYLYVNTPSLPFNTSEVLSYLSMNNFAILFDNQENHPRFLSYNDSASESLIPN